MLNPTIQGYSFTSVWTPLIIFWLFLALPHSQLAAIPGEMVGGGVVGGDVLAPGAMGHEGLQKPHSSLPDWCIPFTV